MSKLTSRSELAATPASGDLLHIVDVSDATDNVAGSSKKIQVSNLLGNTYQVGGTDVAVADGGTGASTAAGARTNLSATNVAGDTMTGQLDFSGTSHAGIKLNSLTTTQRDALTPAAGMLIYNSTDASVQKYQGGAWSNVTAATGGDASTNTSSSVDDELVLFSGTAGKTLKRATTTGVLKGTSGVLSAATAGTDYYAPGSTDVAIADGGTGQSTATAAFDALAPTTTQGDIIYHNGTDNVRLAKGTAAQVLTMNAGATAPEWAAAGGGGGQTTYDAVVASSGGDYTTLGAAITAASNGWRIFVRSGTYTESAISSGLTDLTIEGENPKNTIISHGSNAIALYGGNLNLKNLRFTGSSGDPAFQGSQNQIFNCHFIYTSSATIEIQGESVIDNCYFDHNYTSSMSTPLIYLNGSNFRFVNNYIYAYAKSTANNSGILYCGSSSVVSNNQFISRGTASDSAWVIYSGGQNTISSNLFSGFIGGSKNAYVARTGSSDTFIGNYAYQAMLYINANSARISDNYVYSTQGTYIMYLNGSRCIIDGNYFYGNNAVEHGIYINDFSSDINNTVITSNVFDDFATTGVNVSSSTQDDTIIESNQFYSTTTPVTNLGTGTVIRGNVGTGQEQESQVVWAKNTSGGTVAAGSLVVWKAVASGNEITTTTTGGDAKVWGVTVSSISNNATGRVQTLGKVTNMTVNGTTDIAIGDYISTYTSAGIGKKASAGETVIAIALEAYATDDSSGVIDALIIAPRLI